MLKINDNGKLDYYIRKYNIDDIFSTSMRAHMELLSFKNNDYICTSDEKLEYLYFLVEGTTKIYILLKNGKSLLLQFYMPLKVIGDLEFMDNTMTSSNVQVVGKTTCIGIPMDVARKHGLNDTKFLKFICRSLSEKLNICSISSSINLLYPLENRLASYIMAFAPKKNSYEITVHKLTEMADLLGTSYRHLTRTMNKLCSDGIIKKHGDSIIILDRPSLEQLAGDIYK